MLSADLVLPIISVEIWFVEVESGILNIEVEFEIRSRKSKSPSLTPKCLKPIFEVQASNYS